jgi:hypothetical protein
MKIFIKLVWMRRAYAGKAIILRELRSVIGPEAYQKYKNRNRGANRFGAPLVYDEVAIKFEFTGNPIRLLFFIQTCYSRACNITAIGNEIVIEALEEELPLKGNAKAQRRARNKNPRTDWESNPTDY